jgi:hypothetical protein
VPEKNNGHLTKYNLWFAPAVVVLAATILGCRGQPAASPGESPAADAPDGPAWFEDVTDRVGLDFVHDPGDVGKYLMWQSIGSGCAIHDLDGDGRPDLLLLTNAGPQSTSTNRLYRQKPDGTFADATAGSGLDFPGWNMGVAIGDVNNDGRPDVLVTQAAGARLLLNRGGLTFADVTEQAGIDNPSWGTACAMLDHDRDGRLDLLVVNYVDYDPTWPCLAPSGERDYCAPRVFPGTASRLFRNTGGEVPTFEDVTGKSGIGAKTGPGLGVAVADFDGDGRPDVFVANDGRPNHLWINRPDGTFREKADERNVARTATGDAFAGMGVALGDVDNDGMQDLFVTHLTGETNTLWTQGPRGQFRDRTEARGLTATKWRGTGFGTVLADFDHDGALDLAVVNGRVAREPVPRKKPGVAAHWEPYAERSQLFAGAGTSFRDVSHNNPALCGRFAVARGLACGDVDGDGAPDLLVNAIGERARLLKNVAPGRGHWVAVRAIDPALNRDAVGAEVAVKAGGVRRARVVASSDSFLSAGPGGAHFGLGHAETVDEFEVAWPDGSRERFPGGPAGRTVELRKGAGSRTPRKRRRPGNSPRPRAKPSTDLLAPADREARLAEDHEFALGHAPGLEAVEEDFRLRKRAECAELPVAGRRGRGRVAGGEGVGRGVGEAGVVRREDRVDGLLDLGRRRKHRRQGDCRADEQEGESHGRFPRVVPVPICGVKKTRTRKPVRSRKPGEMGE